jgi:hypothetical protein
MDVFHIGPQKAATTWVYRCLREHPDVACPPNDTIHFYDMYYHRGARWYAEHFKDAGPRQKKFDPTYTYLRSPWAPRRIAADNPEAKIIMCLRHPIDRAFSHYWHEKKKGKYNFSFEEVLKNYDLFASWIEPGLYAEHIERFLRHFPRDQIRCLLFDDLREDPEGFLHEILTFARVDPDFEPSFLHRKANEAGGRRTLTNRVWRGVRRRLQWTTGQGNVAQALQSTPVLGRLLQDRVEYESGIDPEVRQELEAICAPEIERLEDLLSIDLSIWKKSDSHAT